MAYDLSQVADGALRELQEPSPAGRIGKSEDPNAPA